MTLPLMSGGPLPLSLFDYALPPELIAQEPARPRDSSRLLRVQRGSGAITHHVFRELPGLLREGDLLVVNSTKVIPARLYVKRETGGKVEMLFLTPLEATLQQATRWQVMGRPGDAFRPGKTLVAPDGTRFTVESKEGADAVVRCDKPVWPLLEQFGEMPLPPYIAANDNAKDDYQTIFAKEPGAVAAPTASLHFTPDVLNALADRGVTRAEVVLHVGAGTFLPVREEHEHDVRGHTMHSETYDISAATIEAIKKAKRVVCVGTTSARAVETWANTGATQGASSLFIIPGYEFKVVQALLTNFHLPKSTLLMLVSALAGHELIMKAYADAIAHKYRFFSYGDAMLIDT